MTAFARRYRPSILSGFALAAPVSASLVALNWEGVRSLGETMGGLSVGALFLGCGIAFTGLAAALVDRAASAMPRGRVAREELRIAIPVRDERPDPRHRR